ncbi:hypothetical protein [Psychrobacter sp. FDAARGOS_221]|uniref:hypothetical protein n=1 Tax=Psychrobacter sp. FDAARGOS_221 TaxID=1975705 RepID=UPI000BB5671A|nr:hypothetical protein [Psychrobacter sp. FDAARGOS_221]PNK59484.1 hypothetical protein A6J60_000340 [Psychrobacter sp. FDAARGOS_221]
MKSAKPFNYLVLATVILAAIAAVYFLESYFQLRSELTSEPPPLHQQVTAIDIAYPFTSKTISYNIQQHPEAVEAIVKDLNSLHNNRWRQSLGGKEGSNSITITVTDNQQQKISYSFSGTSILKRAPDYRQLNVKGDYTSIDLDKLPALKAIWSYNASLKHDQLPVLSTD